MLKDVERCGCFHAESGTLFSFVKRWIWFRDVERKCYFVFGRDFNQTKHLEGKCFSK